jgi:prepilin-type N-terminal cleavage/methylation domain-containing protein
MNNKGFTLIEAMIALAILSIGLLAVAKMQGTALWGNNKSGILMDAGYRAQSKLETLIATPYGQVVSGGPALTNDKKFTVTWTVSEEDSPPGVKSILVVVRNVNTERIITQLRGTKIALMDQW